MKQTIKAIGYGLTYGVLAAATGITVGIFAVTAVAANGMSALTEKLADCADNFYEKYLNKEES